LPQNCFAYELTHRSRFEKPQGSSGPFVLCKLGQRQHHEDRAMATEAFEEIVEDFEFLDDWEDRYRYVID